MELQSPTKHAKKLDEATLVDDKQKSLSPESGVDEDNIEDFTRRFVGEVDLPEGMCLGCSTRLTHKLTNLFLAR